MSATPPIGPFSGFIGPVLDGVREFHALPDIKKAKVRAMRGAFLGTLCIYYVPMTGGNLEALTCFGVVFAVALLWLIAGFRVRGPVDLIGGAWWGLAALLFGFTLFCAIGQPDYFEGAGLFIAGLVASAVRFWLAVRPMPSAKAPDPRKLGHPMAGPASVRAAHAAMSRRGSAARPKFKT